MDFGDILTECIANNDRLEKLTEGEEPENIIQEILYRINNSYIKRLNYVGVSLRQLRTFLKIANRNKQKMTNFDHFCLSQILTHFERHYRKKSINKEKRERFAKTKETLIYLADKNKKL